LHVAFSIREKVAESRMRGYFKLLNFLAFPFTKFPHPPLTWLPLSQNGRGFSEVTVLMIWHWVRAIKAARKGPSPSGRRWLKAG
jgi:hypothetical protein